MESRIEARLAGMQAHMADWKADMADWKADMAKRETRMLLAVAGMIGLAVAILGILISLPASSLPPDPTMRRFTPRFSRGLYRWVTLPRVIVQRTPRRRSEPATPSGRDPLGN
ncbi:MAG: hypothetical protein OXE82_06800 [Rhodobacter sp.]|nr:hypothetical protein [Rhodobacter sp.]